MAHQGCQNHVHIGACIHHHGVRQLWGILHRQVYVVGKLLVYVTDIS